LRGKILITQSKFKEAENEFQQCLVRIGDSDPNMSAACYYELILVTILGSKGKAFNVGDIRQLYTKAVGFDLVEYKVWGEEHVPSQTYELIKMVFGIIYNLKLKDDQQLVSTGYKLVNDKLSLPIKVVDPIGKPCASCGLAFQQMMKCSRCKSNDYFVCGVECQKKDWALHKSHCAPK
jgi:hypothetical protein